MAGELLSDAKWARIEAMLPGKASDSRFTAADNRRFIEAVLWIARTGSPWRDLPTELGNWRSTYSRGYALAYYFFRFVSCPLLTTYVMSCNVFVSRQLKWPPLVHQ